MDMIDQLMNGYRLDVDVSMAAAQEQARESEAERQKAIAVWRGISIEMERGTGPFAQMLAQFRDDATKALSDLVYADPADAKHIQSLQANVRRCLDTMEHIQSFRTAAEAADANTEGDTLSDDDDTFTPPEVDE